VLPLRAFLPLTAYDQDGPYDGANFRRM